MNLHPNNKHNSGYDLTVLGKSYPELAPFIFTNAYGTDTIDFGNPQAVKALNTALLFQYYNITFWEFPDANLCPPIPGRVDYIHYLNDLIPTKGKVNVLDIGTGANCIYPILGNAVYNWSFVGTDIDKSSLNYAEQIIQNNDLNDVISLRLQNDSKHILKGIITKTDAFTVSMCNPPFYKSEAEALQAATRKLKGLNRNSENVIRNFAGKHNELWYKGGEKAFLHNYLYESSLFKDHCVWFTSLVSQKELIRGLKVSLKKLGATSVKVIKMGTGNKLTRIIAWSFKQ